MHEEELKSGIVVRRDDHLAFWHLIFQEYLAARSEEKQEQLLLAQPKFYQPEWRETVLLLAGVLYRQGVPRVDAMFAAVLEQLGEQAPLAENARCFGLLGAAVQDLAPVNYQPASPRYQKIADAVLDIFAPRRAKSFDIRTAIDAAEALGQVGDPRFAERNLNDNWVDIPAGAFSMGSQKDDPQGRNFDSRADDDEFPVRQVQLSAYRIGKYPWEGDKIDPSLANYNASKIGCPTPVGVCPRGATPDGILDMAGNVLEWCQDRWSRDYSKAASENSTGPDQGDGRVFRGGCFADSTRYCRGAFRNWSLPTYRGGYLGFRVVGVLAARTK